MTRDLHTATVDGAAAHARDHADLPSETEQWSPEDLRPEPRRTWTAEELRAMADADPWNAPPNPDWTDEPPFEAAS
jgi:hypothetical protein